jgi:hypothetical protein
MFPECSREAKGSRSERMDVFAHVPGAKACLGMFHHLRMPDGNRLNITRFVVRFFIKKYPSFSYLNRYHVFSFMSFAHIH